MSIKVCVASSFPERDNLNVSLVADLAEGFGEILGEENVYRLPYNGLAAQVARLKPALLVMVGSALRPQWDYAEVTRACRASKTIFAFWAVEDPYEFDVKFRFTELADLVFTNDRWAACFYDRERVHHLPTAASKKLLRTLDNYHDRALDVFFCGVGFANRRTLVNDALPVLERRRTLIIGENWPAHPGGILVNRRLKHTDLIEHYAASRCVLNLGRTFCFANSQRALAAVTPGPRTFEAAMVGCVQLYFQPSQFLCEYFTPGSEIIPFETVEELDDKLGQLMADPDHASVVARAAQIRAVNEHSFDIRAQEILRQAGLLPGKTPLAQPAGGKTRAIPVKTDAVRA